MADVLKFTEDHLWLRVEGNRAQLGISEYGQAELGEIIAVELPDVGDEVEKGEREKADGAGPRINRGGSGRRTRSAAPGRAGGGRGPPGRGRRCAGGGSRPADARCAP